MICVSLVQSRFKSVPILWKTNLLTIKKEILFQASHHFGTWDFDKSFRHGCFITGTFWHVHRSALWMIQQMDISTREGFYMRTFWHRTFRHMDILAQAPKCLPKRPCCFARCQNIHVPKCSGAEISHAQMSLVPKIPRAKKSPCRNVHLRSALQTFPGRCQNVPGMKNPCKNVSCQNLRFRNGR